MIRNLIFIFGLLNLIACQPMNPYTKIAPGTWRGTLLLDPSLANQPRPSDEDIVARKVKMEGNPDGVLPFNFEVKYTGDNDFNIILHNGLEEIVLDEISFGRDRKTGNDTLIIKFPAYENFITAIVKENVMAGYFVNPNKANYRVPFKAIFGVGHRFEPENQPKEIFDFNGHWAVQFDKNTPKPFDAIGEFVQKNDQINGTFRTESGDFRYLEGQVVGDKLMMACFDGAHAMLFRAKMLKDTLVGGVWYGYDNKATWEGVKNDKFDLKNPESIQTAISNKYTLNTKYPNTSGLDKGFLDPQYDNKLKIITISGTWCPNCRDEIAFLKEYTQAHPNLPITVFPFYFERHDSKEKSMEVLKRYKDKMNIPFELFYGGKANKDTAAARFPMISGISAFPTMIILDKNNNIIRVHTGFDGPATSRYDLFKKEFEEFIGKHI